MTDLREKGKGGVRNPYRDFIPYVHQDCPETLIKNKKLRKNDDLSINFVSVAILS